MCVFIWLGWEWKPLKWQFEPQDWHDSGRDQDWAEEKQNVSHLIMGFHWLHFKWVIDSIFNWLKPILPDIPQTLTNTLTHACKGKYMHTHTHNWCLSLGVCLNRHLLKGTFSLSIHKGIRKGTLKRQLHIQLPLRIQHPSCVHLSMKFDWWPTL